MLCLLHSLHLLLLPKTNFHDNINIPRSEGVVSTGF